MTEETKNPWDEATKSGNFVNLEPDEAKVIVVHEWELKEVEKFGEEQWEFSAKVIEEDGEALEKEKLFNTTSRRLKKKLRDIFENKGTKDEVKLSIMKVGEGFDTQYSVKELPRK